MLLYHLNDTQLTHSLHFFLSRINVLPYYAKLFLLLQMYATLFKFIYLYYFHFKFIGAELPGYKIRFFIYDSLSHTVDKQVDKQLVNIKR